MAAICFVPTAATWRFTMTRRFTLTGSSISFATSTPAARYREQLSALFRSSGPGFQYLDPVGFHTEHVVVNLESVGIGGGLACLHGPHQQRRIAKNYLGDHG